MPIKNNPTLGYTICSECGEEASVHQQSRGQGRYLYTRGCECKFRNSTGKTFQSRLWWDTKWVPEARPKMPPNVEDRKSALIDAKHAAPEHPTCSSEKENRYISWSESTDIDSDKEENSRRALLAAGVGFLVAAITLAIRNAL